MWRPAGPLALLAALRSTLASGHATSEQVLADQLSYSCAWREQFNRGAIQAAAYAEGASLRVAAGPAGEGETSPWRQLLGCEALQGGHELRGRSAVAGFWEKCVSFKEWGAYQDAAWSRTAVDDDTVLVKGKVGFASAYGETVELWRRSEDRWVIESTMLTVQEGHADAAGMGLAEELCAERRGEAAEIVGDPTSAPAEAALAGGGEGEPEGAVAPPAPAGVASPSAAGDVFFAAVALVAIGGGAYMIRRSRRRRTAQISGFDSMLG